MNEIPFKTAKKHGGKRENAGRKAQYQEKTVVMRVPESKVNAVKAWLKPRHPDDIEPIYNLQKLVAKARFRFLFHLNRLLLDFHHPRRMILKRL
jgi:DNA polymerase V